MVTKVLKCAKFLVKDLEGKPLTVVIELVLEDNEFVVLQHFGDPYLDEVFTTDRIDNYGPEDDEKADMHFIYACNCYLHKFANFDIYQLNIIKGFDRS